MFCINIPYVFSLYYDDFGYGFWVGPIPLLAVFVIGLYYM